MLKSRKCFQPYFRSLPRRSSFFSKSDIYVYGSDEIWNVRRKVFQRKQFYGTGFNNPGISYATSVNDSMPEDFKDNRITEGIKHLKMVTVRDEHTKRVISDVFGKESDIVLDPSFFLSKEEYKMEWYDKEEKSENRQPFILVYLSGNNELNVVTKEIIRFARCQGLELISIGWRLNWTKERFFANPKDFIKLFIDAKYVVTNTFHGACFSINFNKNVAFVKGANKLSYIVNEYGLCNRYITNPGDLFRIFNIPVDYNNINKRINALKLFSKKKLIEGITIANTYL